MKRPGKFKLGLLLTAGALFGCSPQEKFSHQIARADRVIVTKSGNGTAPLTMTLNGEDAHGAIEAVASAERCGDVAPDAKALKVVFCRGTNLLGTILTSEGFFWTPSEGNLEYRDNTGSLRSLEKLPPERWH